MIMAKNYYYLVAGLADLVLDEGKSQVSFTDFVAEIEEQIAEPDQKLLQCIRLPFDNKNLIAVLEQQDREFDNRGNFSREEMQNALKDSEIFPQYMQDFIEVWKEKKAVFQGLIPEDQLNCFFYGSITSHKNQFIREWFTFDRDLRNLIAGMNSRKKLSHFDSLKSEREPLLSKFLVGGNDVAETILRSNAPDFGAISMVPWAEKLFAMSSLDIDSFEKGVDMLRWDMLDELTIFSYFQIETILAYCIKLTLVERWRSLDSKTGGEILEKLVEELKSGFSVPAEF